MLESAFDSPVNPAEWQVLLTHRSCGELVVMGAGRERPIFISTPFRYDETRGIRAPGTSFESSPAAISERLLVTMTVYAMPLAFFQARGTANLSDPLWSAPTRCYAAAHATGRQ